MAWECQTCTRWWGRSRSYCPLCNEVKRRQRCVARLLPDQYLCRFIGSFLQFYIAPLVKASMCRVGTALNCRCAKCKHGPGHTHIVLSLSRKCNRGRATAARWIHLLTYLVRHCDQGTHNVLHGLLLCLDYGRRDSTYSIDNSKMFDRPYIGFMRQPAGLLWFLALFLQYTPCRPKRNDQQGRELLYELSQKCRPPTTYRHLMHYRGCSLLHLVLT